jgi:CheY-like chemotaxis protein
MVAALALVWTAPQRNEFGPPSGQATNRTGNGHPAPATILVVEDEILVRLAVGDFLRECGYRVVEAFNGEEAQKVLKAGEPVEILFSDVDLGKGINGFVLASWVRQNYPGVRILLTSAVERMAQDATHLCDGPLLQKPYEHSLLADHIKRLLSTCGRQAG